MAIPTAGLINKWDAFDPSCYNPASPTQLSDLVGSIAIPINGAPVFNATEGSLEFSGAQSAYTAAGVRPTINIHQNYTVSTWIKFRDVSSDQFSIFSIGTRDFSIARGFGVWFLTASAQCQFKMWDYISASSFNPGANYGGIDTWNNVTVTASQRPFASVEMKWYWNGILVYTTPTDLGGGQLNATSNLDYSGYSGMTYSNNAVYGPMLIYNQTKSAGDVQDIYDFYINRLNTPPAYAGNVGGRIFGEGLNG